MTWFHYVNISNIKMYIFDLGDSFFEILVNKWHHVEIVWCVLQNLKVWTDMDLIFMTSKGQRGYLPFE